MKRINIVTGLLVSVSVVLFSACKETPPEIDYSIPVDGDTTYMEAVESPQPKKVLFEEFTGVKCTNCPESHELIKTIIESNPNKIIPVSLHSGGLSIPYNTGDEKSAYDFRTDEAANIFSNLGAQAQPQGAADRIKFDGEATIALFTPAWKERIESRTTETPPVNVYIETYYQKSTQKLYIAVTTKLTEKIDAPLSISCGITEDSLIDLQGSKDKITYPPHGVIHDYMQRHVLRTMPSGWNGRLLNAPDQEAGRVVVRNFVVDFTGKGWNIDKCSVYAFVHYTGTEKEVLQAAEVHAK